MLVCARMFPLNTEPEPTVAALPTCQKMLASEPVPPSNVTSELEAVVRVLPIWKMNVPFGLLVVLRLSVPVNWADVSKR